MKISERFWKGAPLISFEFFPPKDDAGAAALMETAHQLEALKPAFISVTYGAGGSTRNKTLQLVVRIKRETGIESMAHLTCVGHGRVQIRQILQELADSGVENILALRGDPPKGETRFQPAVDGFRYASELAEEVARQGRFCFGVAGYPEKHIEAPTMEGDLQHLKNKVDMGASFVITQLFFNNDRYFDFVAKARAIGIRVPIIPGLMPITNFSQIQRFATLCGATLSEALIAELTPVQADAEMVARIGIRQTAAQSRELLQRSAPGIHFYTLNKSRATREIVESLGPLRQGPGSALLSDI